MHSFFRRMGNITKKNKLAVWGWWQGNNLGDNWIKQINQEQFPHADFVDTDFMDINSYGFVLIGGGGLFINDIIAPWDGDIKVPYGVIGIGAEFDHENNKVKELAENACFFLARDSESYVRMKMEKGPESYDVTFCNPLPWIVSPSKSSRVICVFYEEDLKTNPLYDRYTCGEDFEKKLFDLVSGYFNVVEMNDFQTKSCNIAEIITDADCVISGKFHGIVAAIQRGIPCIAIDMSAKIYDIMRACRLGQYCIPKNELNRVPELLRQIDREYEDIRQKMYNYRTRANLVMQKQYTEMKEIIRDYVKV